MQSHTHIPKHVPGISAKYTTLGVLGPDPLGVLGIVWWILTFWDFGWNCVCFSHIFCNCHVKFHQLETIITQDTRQITPTYGGSLESSRRPLSNGDAFDE